MECKTCKEQRNVIPYIAHEAAEARHERHIKRLIIALVISILLMFASNVVWLVYLYQYDFGGEKYTAEVETEEGGNANYIGESGDIYNGENPGN